MGRLLLLAIFTAMLAAPGCAKNANTIHIGETDGTTALKFTGDELYINPNALGFADTPDISIHTSFGNSISVNVGQEKNLDRTPDNWRYCQ